MMRIATQHNWRSRPNSAAPASVAAVVEAYRGELLTVLLLRFLRSRASGREQEAI